jgi:hypothetical protein
LLSDPKKESHQPIGKVQSENQEPMFLQISGELLHDRQVLLQRADEIESVFFPNDKLRSSGDPAKNVIDRRNTEFSLPSREIFFGRFRPEGADFGPLGAAKPSLIQSVFQEPVKGRRKKEVKGRDGGQMAQC